MSPNADDRWAGVFGPAGEEALFVIGWLPEATPDVCSGVPEPDALDDTCAFIDSGRSSRLRGARVRARDQKSGGGESEDGSTHSRKLASCTEERQFVARRCYTGRAPGSATNPLHLALFP